MEKIIEVKGVSKSYGKKIALDNLSLEVEKGDIFGLLGPNGAGKTTLIRMINQITTPDSGEILFGGEPLSEKHIKDVGYLPEERGLYKKMKVGQQALYLSELKGMRPKDARKELDIWLQKFEIADWYNKKVQELSKGMQQKVQFITTVMHHPKLLIFDEPFSGFDPLNADLIKTNILELREKGATIMFSTHNMESVEQICDKIVLINKSKNILSGSVNEIKQRFKKGEYEIVLVGDFQDNYLLEDIELLSHKQKDGLSTIRIKIPKGKNAELLSNILKYTDIISYSEVLPTMNEIFIQTVKENNTENE